MGPFSCEECPATFVWKQHLKRHISTKHSNLSLMCQYCGYRSKRKDNMDRHLKTKHAEDVNTGCCNQTSPKKDENIILQVCQAISSTENLRSSDTGMKHYKSSSQQNKFCFAPNIQAFRKSQERNSNQTRKSVIIKNNDTFPQIENSASNEKFLITEYEHSVINDGQILKKLLVSPYFSELYLHSKGMKKSFYSCKEGLLSLRARIKGEEVDNSSSYFIYVERFLQ
jgi:hypothetical protein